MYSNHSLRVALITNKLKTMGREVRMVPKDWEHPKNERRFIPLCEGFNERLKDWKTQNAKWNEGLRDDWQGGWKALEGDELDMTYSEWAGEKPKKEDYMPEWKPEEKTHFMMYEDTSEGTPVSPAFETPEELARWLTDNNASAFAGQGASYEGWLRVCKGGYAPSMVISNGAMQSGVDAFS